MRPAPFRYSRPETLEQALELKARHGDEASVLAGGQSLVPMLAMRVARVLLLSLRCLLVMRCMPVMLPQQVEAVVVAVRRAHDGVDVEFRRLRVGQEHAGVVVEFNEGHRALHPVIERAVFREAADPAEMRVGQVPLELADARRARPLRQRHEVLVDEIGEFASLQGRELAALEAFIRHDPVVLERAAEVQVVGEMPPPLWQVAPHHGVRHDGALLLFG